MSLDFVTFLNVLNAVCKSQLFLLYFMCRNYIEDKLAGLRASGRSEFKSHDTQ